MSKNKIMFGKFADERLGTIAAGATSASYKLPPVAPADGTFLMVR